MALDRWEKIKAVRLADLPFTELHLSKVDARYRSAGRSALSPLPSPLRREARDVFEHLSRLAREKDVYFSIALAGHVCRVVVIDTGEIRNFIIHRSASCLVDWKRLGLPEAIRQRISDRLQEQGLFFFSGPEGSGKRLASTSAFVDELRTKGGVGVVIGPSLPYDLSGGQGAAGICYEFDLLRHTPRSAFRQALKLNADYILLYDSGDGDCYRYAMDLAAIGTRVLCTLTARSASEALIRFVSGAVFESTLANHHTMAYRDFSSRLAQTLVTSLHLDPHPVGPGGGVPTTRCRLHEVRHNPAAKSRISSAELAGFGQPSHGTEPGISAAQAAA